MPPNHAHSNFLCNMKYISVCNLPPIVPSHNVYSLSNNHFSVRGTSSCFLRNFILIACIAVYLFHTCSSAMQRLFLMTFGGNLFFAKNLKV